MLTTNDEAVAVKDLPARSSSTNKTSNRLRLSVEPSTGRSRQATFLTIEWLGQTVASVFWLISMLVYGISSSGDWLQLPADSAGCWQTSYPLGNARPSDDHQMI